MKLIFIFFFGLIVYISFNTTVLNPYMFDGADKLKHLIAFFVLSFLFKVAFKDIRYRYYILVPFALLIEIGQLYTQRESSFYDFLFSALGIGLFFILERYFKFKKE